LPKPINVIFIFLSVRTI